MPVQQKRQFRKRKALEEEDGDGGGEQEEQKDVRSTLEEVRLLQQQRSRLNSTAPSPFPPPPPLPPHLPHLSSLQPRARGSPPAAAAARAPVLMSALEEVRLLQQQRVRLKGIAADGALTGAEGAEGKGGGAGAQGEAGEEGEGGEELVLQDTFAQETAITVEDPNMLKCIEEELAKRRGGAELSHMPQLKYIEEELVKRRGDVALKYIEEELAKRRGGGAGAAGGSRGEGEGDDEVLRAEDKLYEIPQHLQVGKLEGEEGGTAWTTGIAEVQLPIDYKLGNIEATEEAKRMMQERRPWMNRPRPPSTTLPASYSADFFQRGREYAEKLKRDNPDIGKAAPCHHYALCPARYSTAEVTGMAARDQRQQPATHQLV
ncbi:unnamed protein product [Closterium sp. NIES-65]|nr:unnamed protein product [Closterium sp. NIES-65]